MFQKIAIKYFSLRINENATVCQGLCGAFKGVKSILANLTPKNAIKKHSIQWSKALEIFVRWMKQSFVFTVGFCYKKILNYFWWKNMVVVDRWSFLIGYFFTA